MMGPSYAIPAPAPTLPLVGVNRPLGRKKNVVKLNVKVTGD